jgi:hypothetical protein
MAAQTFKQMDDLAANERLATGNPDLVRAEPDKRGTKAIKLL